MMLKTKTICPFETEKSHGLFVQKCHDFFVQFFGKKMLKFLVSKD